MLKAAAENVGYNAAVESFRDEEYPMMKGEYLGLFLHIMIYVAHNH